MTNYQKRIGLIRVDGETQERIVKGSGEWYSRLFALNGVTD